MSKKRIAELVFTAFFMSLFSAGCAEREDFYFTRGAAETEISAEMPAEEKTEERQAELVVHVSGAVKNPGVYRLQEGQRLNDAVEAAGGFTEDAARDACNLAVIVQDGCQYHIPYIGEATAAEQSGCYTTDGLLDINLAGTEELMQLRGIGRTKAEAIVEYRNVHGRYQTVEELLQVSGIGESTFEGIRDAVTVR